MSTASVAQEQALLRAARDGDEGAFRSFVEPHRAELHAHCYRMLGSVHDAEDAVQDVLLRAWRGLRRFEGRSSRRTWLYKIATNTCLDEIARRPKRVLPAAYGPATPAGEGVGPPLVLALLGSGLLELLERRYGSPRGDDIWVAAAVVAMLLSLLGPIIAGLTISATVGLLAIHITAGAILIALLPQGIRLRGGVDPT